MNRYEVRARELMLRGDEARRYAVLAETGVCPDCRLQLRDRYESTVCQHARLCTGEDSADRAERALGVQ